jgi:hypothetical protein
MEDNKLTLSQEGTIPEYSPEPLQKADLLALAYKLPDRLDYYRQKIPRYDGWQEI